MKVTIFTGEGTSHAFNGMDILPLQIGDRLYSVNAKDIDQGMQVQIDGKFQRVVRLHVA